MPEIDDDDSPALDPARLSFRERVREGRVVPIISDPAIFDLVLGGFQAFVARYARYVKYPGEGQPDLVTLVKYHKHVPQPLDDQVIKSDYLNYVKNHVLRMARTAGMDQDTLDSATAQIDKVSASEFANLLGYPSFSGGRSDPLLTVASLPFKTILTTSPYTFVEDALRRAGKSPRTEVCRWRQDLKDSIKSVIDDEYEPTEKSPLVYHLLGLDRYPDSLVLTEDDYLDYLGNICQGKDDDRADFIPALVSRAFSDDLVVLGFSLDSWAFRVLYSGLIKRRGKPGNRGVCGIQLPDTPAEHSFLQDYVKDYVERETKFQVFWGDLPTYTQRELQPIQ